MIQAAVFSEMEITLLTGSYGPCSLQLLKFSININYLGSVERILKVLL